MDTEPGVIYVDGQPVETEYNIINNSIMVPLIFLKHVGVRVDWNSKRNLSIIRTNNEIIKFPANCSYAVCYLKNEGKSYREPLNIAINDTSIPLDYIAMKLHMKLVHLPKVPRIYLITNIHPWLKPQLLYRVETTQNKVALTFDDGPDRYSTPKILDILRDKNVPATFFIMGQQAEIFPEILRRIVKEGHSIGNHSWSHPYLNKLTTNQVIKEIKKTNNLIQTITGIKTDIIRPPYGFLTDADFYILNELGLKPIAWTVDTLDYKGFAEDRIIETVLREVSPGSIILQHSNEWTPGILDGSIKALPIIIDKLQSQGVEFVTIENLIKSS